MKKIITIGIFLTLSIFFITGCKKNNTTAEIIIEETEGIPYTWNYTITNKEIVKYKTKKEETNTDTEIVGASNKVHYIFQGLKEGKTTIKFELKSITDNEVSENKVYEVIVDKNLNITINETK